MPLSSSTPQYLPPDAGSPALQLAAAQALPKATTPCQVWRLVTGLLCLGPTQTVQAEAPVHGVARAGDWVCLPPDGVTWWALVPCALQPLPRPSAPAQWQGLLAQLCTQQCRQAADLARMRSGPVTERVHQMLLMLAGPGQTCPALPSLRAMSQLVDAAPETVSRVVSALRQSRLLDGGRRAPAGPAVCVLPLAAVSLPTGLTRSEAVARRARLLALKNSTGKMLLNA